MTQHDPDNLIRPLVRELHPYVYGEQPKIKGLIKLNTNENPYPPSPTVLAAVKAAVDGRLRLYPQPASDRLREKLARLHHCRPENILVGNGSDELLALAVRAFVEPEASVGGRLRRRFSARPPRAAVQFFQPSYSLYPVLAAIHGAAPNPVPLGLDFVLPTAADLRRGRAWDFDAALTFITTPNAPTGRGCGTAELRALCVKMNRVVVLDEAYADFAAENALALALERPNVIVARTFSKAYSLCFQRVGYAVGHPALIEALNKIKDSYNVNGLGQVAAEATLEDLPYYQANFQRVIATREELRRELAGLGFQTPPSEANFIFVRPPQFSAESWLARLRERKVLVRWFGTPETRSFLRISIGTAEETAALLRAVRAILRG
jgi:histidinol-phosphate aminotransferase